MAARKIFLDNNRNYKEIYKILVSVVKETEDGDVSPIIIIGHPHRETIRAIADITKTLRGKGVAIVPVSKLVKNKALQGSS